MFPSLSESSTWIACGVAMIYILEQGTCLAVHSALPQRQGGQWEITRRSAAQLQQAEPMSGIYDGTHPTRFARFAVPGSIEEHHDGNAEPNGEYGKIVRPGIPSGHGLRRVLGDLETCAEDIFMPFASETDAEQPVTVSGSKLRSCREAIFSLIRWLDTQRKEIHAPAEKNPYLQSSGLQDSNSRDAEKSYDKGENTIEKRASMANVKQQSCEVTDCRPFERPHVYSYAMETSAEKSKMCKMCNPRNEELIRRHFTKQRRRLRNILYLILGIVIAVSSAATVVVCVRKAKGKSRDTSRVGPACSSEQGGVLPGLISTIRKSRGVNRRSDVETQSTASQLSPEQDGHISPVRRSDSFKLRGYAGRTRPTTPTAWDEK
ncbi:uncharacterized protein BDCG_08511 [Blastomyces dermatitidis ER-3]|uniref:Transmembrane protein n=1 Tax=Ajellomyces dermatitidis (strain ER-3 / ATCC MYA-2586) TaxID=559297 RepID=A0ABP2EPT2_AJEDR|nr:uncharacterized protein BDCG_08511 [Blastomyces dermatitidis ER-3]EEQ85242.1 hypothetical protein BDCG_08511 [Blastomyces dermatitidis ER-3]